MILQPETVKLDATKSYILVDVVGALALEQSALVGGEIVIWYYALFVLPWTVITKTATYQ